MPGIIDGGGPSYISSHSADVILSDIRPIKLQVNALRAINVLLDEFLYSILSAACSLSTDRLRASLLSLLPTSLGKEALLEAEVELRAYWDRTGPADAQVRLQEDDASMFHLQWSFELLRLKCEAYSTLNESDEDPGAESLIHEKMSKEGGTPPMAALMAPAALYLTAILEAICEHVLSNVGRVASRDSSRTNATAQDLFVALCEDHSIYDLFKTMKVYEQIEQLSKAPKGRRSKSFSQTDRLSQSRTSSPYQDQSSNRNSSPVRSRISLEASAGATGGAALTTSGSRSSLEKTRAMKMFMAASRSSNDRDTDSQIGHKNSDSILNESAKQTSSYDEGEVQDEAMLQEFDNLMRSSSTMKMSLTPDRLKTMEVYKQEKERANRRLVPLFKSDSDSSVLPSRASGRRPSLLQVDSIKEDDEDSPKPSHTSRNRHGSVSSPPVSTANSTGRVRSVSTSSVGSRILSRKSSRTATPPVPMPPSPSGTLQGQNRRVQKGQDTNSFPQRTRKVQRNRESIDLDDVMGGSGDEDARPVLRAKPPTTPRRAAQHTVSATTRDLIDFLAEGPPEPPASKFGRDMTDFFADGPNTSTISMDTGKPRGSGRLQRMISKLSLGGSERFRGGTDDSPRSKQFPIPVRQNVQPKTSAGNLSSLANRPIPPRPRPVSPPSPPSRGSLNYDTPSQNLSVTQRNTSTWEQKSTETPLPSLPLAPSQERRDSVSSLNPSPPLPAYVNSDPGNGPLADFSKTTRASNARVTSDVAFTFPAAEVARPPSRAPKAASATLPTSPTRKPVPVLADVAPAPHLSEAQAREMHRLFSKATSAGECRLIFEMFLIKSGITVEPTDDDASHSSWSPSDAARSHPTPADSALEHSVVELFLGGDSAPEQEVDKYQSRKVELDIEVLEPCQSSSHTDTEPTSGGFHVYNGEFHASDDDSPLSNSSVHSSTEEPHESGIISSYETVHVTHNHTLVSSVGA